MPCIPGKTGKSSLARQVVCLHGYALFLILPAPAVADDWTFFRGPDNNGVSAESGWQTHWPASGPKVAWRADVGIGA